MTQSPPPPSSRLLRPRSAGARLLAGVLAALWVGMPARRVAAAGGELEALFRQAQDLRRQGRDREALPLFRRIYAEKPTPVTEAALGLAELAVGEWLRAVRHLKAALARREHPFIARERPKLEEGLRQAEGHLAELDVAGEPAGARVLVNGQPAGQLPLGRPVRVVAGTVVVDVQAPGFASARRVVQVAARTLAREQVRLLPLAPATPVTSPGSVGAGGDDAALARRRRLRLLGWTALGTGVAFLAMGIAGSVVRNQRADEFNGNPDCRPPEEPQVSARCETLISQARTTERLGTAGYALAGAFGASAAVLLFLGYRRQPGNGQAARLACASGPGEIGLGCAYRF